MSEKWEKRNCPHLWQRGYNAAARVSEPFAAPGKSRTVHGCSHTRRPCLPSRHTQTAQRLAAVSGNKQAGAQGRRGRTRLRSDSSGWHLLLTRMFARACARCVKTTAMHGSSEITSSRTVRGADIAQPLGSQQKHETSASCRLRMNPEGSQNTFLVQLLNSSNLSKTFDCSRVQLGEQRGGRGKLPKQVFISLERDEEPVWTSPTQM